MNQICLRRVAASFGAAMLAAPGVAAANEIRIEQSAGAVSVYNLAQVPGGGHALGGFGVLPAAPTPDGLPTAADMTAPARLSGDFAKLSLSQAGGASQVALDLAVTEPGSEIDIDLSGVGADRVALWTRAGTLASKITTQGDGVRNVAVVVDAPGGHVRHDLSFSGAGNVTAGVLQAAPGAELVASVTALGGSNSFEVRQTAANVTADIRVTLDDNGTFVLSQTVPSVAATFDASVTNGSLTVLQDAPGVNITSATFPTYTVNGHAVTYTTTAPGP